MLTMRNGIWVAVILALAGCGGPERGLAPDSAPGSRAVSRGIMSKKLGDCYSGDLAGAVVAFLADPGGKSERGFLRVSWGDDNLPHFASTPGGWFAWADTPDKVVLDANGFRTLISITPDRRAERPGPTGLFCIDSRRFAPGAQESERRLACYSVKDHMNFEEHRYFPISRKPPVAYFAVTLEVFEAGGSRTVEDLIGHLGKVYGKYDGLCQEIADHVWKEPAGGTSP